MGYCFSGLGMEGVLAYTFGTVEGGTRVIQEQSLKPRGILRLLSAVIGKMFFTMAGQRLEDIKLLLEQGSGKG